MSAGFTLLENLVALGLFMIVMVTVTEVYGITTRANRILESTGFVSADIRRFVEEVNKELRVGTIDYTAYKNDSALVLQEGVSTLHIRGRNGEQVTFALNGDESGFAQLEVSRQYSGTNTQISTILSRKITVENLTFLIRPLVDPFVVDPITGAYKANQQPRVTIVLRARLKNPIRNVDGMLDFQTTTVSRLLRR